MLRISVYTLRMYERAGIFIAHRKASGQRLYSENDIGRLRCIRNAINVEKVSIEGIRHVLSLTPCWAVVHCTDEDRTGCPAYNGYGAPCWTLHDRAAFCAERECRTCEVYTKFGDCKSIKERLKQLLPV
jgi:MerR family transcriptional regulator/heat shock protein HspR